MRISDWSSYVCSSYLLTALGAFIVLERQDPYVGLADLRPLQVQAFGLAHPGVDEQLPPPALRAGGHVELRQVRRRIELGRLLLLAQLRSEEHTSELQSLMRISYAVFCLKQKKSNRKRLSTNLEYTSD